MEDPLIPILDTPRDYDIVQLLWRIGEVDEPFLDLTVSRARARKVLRFMGPRVLQVDKRFEQAPRGLEIRDISARRIGALSLYVEGASGALSFWAKGVVERREQEPPGRTRRLVEPSELEQVLERFDPRLAGDFSWTSAHGTRHATNVERQERAPRGGAAARYFIISTR